MLRLDNIAGDRWIDLGHGVEIRVAPLTTATMLAARGHPDVIAAGAAVGEGGDTAAAAHAVAKVLAALTIKAWRGVGDAAGKPAAVTPENVAALLDVWPMFEAFQTKYVAGAMLLDAEKNVSAPLPNGSSAGAPATAKPARKSARPARAK